MTPATAPSLDDLRVPATEPLPAARLPRVAVVILNYNGRHHLGGCFESLAQLDYPREKLEVLLIDNASEDGSVEEMRARHSWVRLEVNARNTGFSVGCNQGARLAPGAEVLVFLNNDMRVEPRWLAELVAPVARGECQATTAQMLSWDGKTIDSAGGGMNFHGIGIQLGHREPPGPAHQVPRRTLFPCGGAMAIDARVFAESGGFDEEFFAYYEDVDLGWRLWVQGHEVRYVPSAVCYHHHSSTSRTFPLETVRLLQVRNPLLACFKNYDDENLRAVLPSMLALAVRRAYLLSGLVGQEDAFRIERQRVRPAGLLRRLLKRGPWRSRRRDLAAGFEVRRAAAADLVGINDWLGNWDHWCARRREVQERRRRPDAEVFRLFAKPHWCVEDERGYRELQRGTADFFGLDRMFADVSMDIGEPHR